VRRRRAASAASGLSPAGGRAGRAGRAADQWGAGSGYRVPGRVRSPGALARARGTWQQRGSAEPRGHDAGLTLAADRGNSGTPWHGPCACGAPGLSRDSLRLPLWRI